MATATPKLNWTSVRMMADHFDYFLFDCDGVLWHGDQLQVGNAFRNIEWLESIGKKVFFVTNNSSISRESMCQKMAGPVFQYKNANIDNLYPAGAIAA